MPARIYILIFIRLIRSIYKARDSFRSFLGKEVCMLSLSDKKFSFFDEIANTLSLRNYLPPTQREREMCISLVNLGVLYRTGAGAYRVTWLNRALLSNWPPH